MKYYTEEHEWVKVEEDEAYIGISAYAANELGDITFVELPEKGKDIIVGDVISVVESVKAASDIYAPVSGTIISVNNELNDNPGLINQSAEEDGWICKLEHIDPDELSNLMNEEEYKKYIDNL